MNNFVAIAITPYNYWVVVSKPCSQSEAEEFRGCEMRGETFKVVTVEEARAHDKVQGREYLSA